MPSVDAKSQIARYFRSRAIWRRGVVDKHGDQRSTLAAVALDKLAAFIERANSEQTCLRLVELSAKPYRFEPIAGGTAEALIRQFGMRDKATTAPEAFLWLLIDALEADRRGARAKPRQHRSGWPVSGLLAA